MNWEIWTDVYTKLCLKQITNENLKNKIKYLINH